MGLRLVDDGSSSGDDRAALADAKQTVVGARLRLQALADRLADVRRRLGAGTPAGQGSSEGSGETTEATGYGSPPPSGSSGSS